MGELRDAAWYDDRFRISDRYNCGIEDAPHYPLWCTVLELLRFWGPPEGVMIDLGCGPGQFATMVPSSYRYVGCDFSSVALDMARSAAPGKVFAPWDAAVDPVPAIGDVYVALEILEHIEDDIGVLSQIPSGSRVVISLPYRDSAGHVRHFASQEEVMDRYSGVLSVSEYASVDAKKKTSGGKAIPLWHVLTGKRP